MWPVRKTVAHPRYRVVHHSSPAAASPMPTKTAIHRAYDDHVSVITAQYSARLVAMLSVLVLLLLGAPAQAQTLTGTALNLLAANGSTLTFANGEFKIADAAGANGLRFFGNELSCWGTNDPCKYRLASNAGNLGGISFNKFINGDPTNQQEVFLVLGSLDQQNQASLGGELRIYGRMRNATGDSAMRLVAVVSTAFATNTDGLPEVWLLPGTHTNTLGQFADGPPPSGPPPPPPPPPAITYPTAITAQVNLVGTVAALQTFGDSGWLTAQGTCCDTDVSASLDVTSKTSVDVEVRRTGTTGTAPYVYAWINGTAVASAWTLPGTGVMRVTIPSGLTGVVTVRVKGAAQDGTLEIGGIRAQ